MIYLKYVEKTNQPVHFATYNICSCGVYYPTSIIDYINSKFVLLLNSSNTATSGLIVPNLSTTSADLESVAIRIANYLGVQVEPFRHSFLYSLCQLITITENGIESSLISGCIRATQLQ